MELDYNYSKKGILEVPQKYQKTPFQGKEFLSDYQKSRKIVISNIKTRIKKHQNFEDIKNDFKIESKETDTKNKLISIIKNNFNDKEKSKLVNTFIKKFEVKKKIFTSYDDSFKENTSEYKHIINYILLANICVIEYGRTKKIKLLNVILKINDLICSEIEGIYKDLELNLAVHCLEKELEFISELERRLEIK